MATKKTRFLSPMVTIAGATFFAFLLPIYLLLAIEQGLEKVGLDCVRAMELVWGGAVAGCVLVPIIFIACFQRFGQRLTNQQIVWLLLLFSLLFDMCWSAALEPYWSSAQTLCYVRDGQNGLELVFSTWLAIPVLMAFGWGFERLFGPRLEKSA